MPDGFGSDDEPLRRDHGDLTAPHPNFPEGRTGATARLWRQREIPDRSALARLRAVLRVLPRRQRCRAWRQPSDRLDRAGGKTDSDGEPARRSGCPEGRQPADDADLPPPGTDTG